MPPPTGLERAAAVAVMNPDKLKFGSGAPPHERWAESVLRERNLNNYEVLKKKLQGGTPMLDTTESDLKGLQGKSNGIGKEIDQTSGNMNRTSGSAEEQQFQEAKQGLKEAEQLLKYESLLATEKEALQDEVVKILQERPGGEEIFNAASNQSDKRAIADNFIKTHKKDLLDALRENTRIMNTESRFNTNSASDEMYASEEAHYKAQLEFETAKLAQESAKRQFDDLDKTKKEFDTPSFGAIPPNKGEELHNLTSNEQVRLASMAPLRAKIQEDQDNITRLEELYNQNKKDAKAALKAGINLTNLNNQIAYYKNQLTNDLTTYVPLQTEQQHLEALRKEKAELPQEILKARTEWDTKQTEQKMKEEALKKAANNKRIAIEHKEKVDEDLASSTRDLLKQVVNNTADKEMEEILTALTSPEGRSAVVAETLTRLDRKMEEAWSSMHKRIRLGRWNIDFEDQPIVDIKKTNTAFKDLLGDTDGTHTESKIQTLIGTDNWNALGRENQEQAVAAYVTKLVHRKVINLKSNLSDGEIRALRSGPFANELIRIGLLKNPDFRTEASRIPGIDASNLENPSPATMQQIKGKLDRDKLFTLLMLGLTSLSMMRQEEEKTH